MRLFTAGPGMAHDTELAVEGAMRAVEVLERVCAETAPNVLVGPPVYVAVFTTNDAMLDVEAEVRRVLQTMAHAARPVKAA